MIVLTVIACLGAAPATCRDVTVPFEGGAFACAVMGQMSAATWATQHPKWRVAGWRCTTIKGRAT